MTQGAPGPSTNEPSSKITTSRSLGTKRQDSRRAIQKHDSRTANVNPRRWGPLGHWLQTMNKRAARHFAIATPQAETVFDEINRT